MKKFLLLPFLICFISTVFSNPINWSSPPATLSLLTDNSSQPKVVIDPNGNATAVWTENGYVMTSTQAYGANWSVAIPLSNSGASSPGIVVDQNGNATAIWLEGGFVKSSYQPFNQSWGSAAFVSSSGASTPDLAVDANGNVVAVWVRNNIVQSATKLFNGNWPNNVNNLSSAFGSNPHVAIGANGSVVAVWYGLNSSTYTIYAAMKIMGGTWHAATAISSAGTNSIYPKIAVDNNGNALAIWFSFVLGNLSNYTNVALQYSYLPASTNIWSAASNVSTGGGGIYNPAYLSSKVAFDGNGNALVLWSNSFDGSAFTINSITRQANGTWIGANTVAPSNLFALAADFAMTPVGDAFSAFMSYDGTNMNIQQLETDIANRSGGFWTNYATLSTGQINGFPSISASANGNSLYATAVWVNDNGTNTTIESVSGTGIMDIPPSALSIVQNSTNYGVFTEYYNTVTWNASTDPNLAGYYIYRDGQFISHVNSSTLQYIDNNRQQMETVVYGVSALMNDGTQSAIISMNYP